MANCCQNPDTLSILSPFFNVLIIKAPSIVPKIDPEPPIRLAPPITTAATASISYPVPSVGCAEISLDARRIPEIAHRKPLNPYTNNFTLSTFTPESFEAASLLPTA